MSERFIHIAVAYLVIGATLGAAMGISGKFTLQPVHAHLLLAGWLSLAMAGVLYKLYPAAAGTKLATAHFWLHNLGLPIFMAGLAAALSTGNDGLVPVVAGGALLLLIGFYCFALNVWLRLRKA
jgi:cbb3-type cytochrome oxidase subunit 1